MKSSPIIAFALLAVVAVAGGCASGETNIPNGQKTTQPTSQTNATESTTDAAGFCGSLCSRQESCDNSLDSQTCRNTCTNGFAAVFPKLRQDVVSLIVQCFDSKDCKTVLEGNVVGACAEEAVATVAPSNEATSFCDGLTSAKKKCGSSGTKAQCLDQAKLYSDDTIIEAANCADRPCNEIDRCVAATFGSLGDSTTTTTTTTSTTNECNGRFSDLGQCTSCAEGACCAEAAACAGDTSCRSYMAACQESGGYSYSECTSMLQNNLPSTSRSILGAYYQCAASKCGSACGFTQN